MHKDSVIYRDCVVAPGSDLFKALAEHKYGVAERLYNEMMERDRKTLEKARKLSQISFDKRVE